jgi:dCMP deaminase
MILKSAENKLYEVIQNIKKPTGWDNSFFLSAALWSIRSHDTQTKCGAVIVKDKRIISTGYNGFVSGIDDSALPTVRPEKYSYMIHAEANAVYNAAKSGVTTLGSTCYVTAMPCLNCVQMLYQCGIKEVYFSDISSPKGEIFSERYSKILGLLGDKLNMLFIPKLYLDQDTLMCVLKSLEK